MRLPGWASLKGKLGFMDHSGDGWAIQANGAWFWGVDGAAGLFLRAPGPDGRPLVLMQHRAAWTSMPLTWGIPGGAREAGETVQEAALREASEETGINPQDVVIIQQQVTTRCAVDYAVRRAPAAHWPGVPRFTSLDGHHWVGLMDPSVREWTYTTVSAFVSSPIEVQENSESIELAWVPEAEIVDLELMAPLRASLPVTSSVVQHGAVDSPMMCANPTGHGPLWLVP